MFNKKGEIFMTIRNIVPRNNNEGQLGTENKKWNKIYTNEIFATKLLVT